MNQIDRIKYYEDILDRQIELNNDLEKLLKIYREHISSYKELVDYYGSDLYMKDVEDSNNNLLPKDLKCGVLSEDLVYNLIIDNKELLNDLLEISSLMVKNI